MMEQHDAIARRAYHGERIAYTADARHRRQYIERSKTAIHWDIVECTRITVIELEAVQRRYKDISIGILIDKPHVIAHKRQRIAVHMVNIPEVDTIIDVKSILRRHPNEAKVVLEDIIDHARRQILARRKKHLALSICLRAYQPN